MNAVEKAIYRHCPLRTDKTMPFLCADGVVEAQKPLDGGNFGLWKVPDALAEAPKNSAGTASAVMNALHSFRKSAIFSGDVTATAVSLPTLYGGGGPQ